MKTTSGARTPRSEACPFWKAIVLPTATTTQVRPDVLEETDGPMLLNGLQGLNHQENQVPRSRILLPDRSS
jgi:hypothetical protein